MKLHYRAILGLSIAFLSACNSPTTPSPPPPPPPPALGIACPAAVSASASAVSGVTVSFSDPTTTGGRAPVQVSCTRQSGSLFTQGTTAVQCTANDAAGQSTSCSFNVTVTFTIAPQLTKTKFLAFGDSITAGEVTVPLNGTARDGSPNYKFIVVPATSYPQQLQNRLRERYTGQASAIIVTNAGLPAETAQNGRVRLRSVLASTPAEVVIILEGYNELTHPTNAADLLPPAALAIEGMVKESKVAGARVILATLPPPRPGGSKAVSTALVTNLNARIRATAAAEGALLVDLYAGMIDEVQRYMGVDGLHPTEAGYERMAELVFAAIRADLEQR
jgi:lysophospholipase L1-like esterase